MVNFNPSPSTRFQPGDPKPANSGMKKGYRYLRPLLLKELKKEIKGKNETMAERLSKSTILHAINGDAALVKIIFDRVDGKDLTIETYDESSGDEKNKSQGEEWQIEGEEQNQANEILGSMIDEADKDERVRKFLEEVFEENWRTIKERVTAEGSAWYPWWKDRVDKFIRMRKEENNLAKVKK